MEDQRIPVAMETFSKGSPSDVASSCPLALHLFSCTCIIQYHNVMSPPTTCPLLAIYTSCSLEHFLLS